MPAPARPRKRRSDAYSKVFDSRKRRVRGLWCRNGHFYANITLADELGRKSARFVLLNAGTLDDAVTDYRRLLTEREDDRLRPVTLAPKLADYVGLEPEATASPPEPAAETPASTPPNPDSASAPVSAAAGRLATYVQRLRFSGKRPATISKELGYVRHWVTGIGHLRLNRIRTHHLSTILTALAAGGLSPRSVNLYLMAIRGVLKSAMRDGYLKPPLPFEGLQWQRVEHKARRLHTPAEIDHICAVARQASRNGPQFVDYLRFLQYTGARRTESLRVRWSDVDFERGQVSIGAEGDAKNREFRVVDFNPQLEAHVKDMKQRRQPDSRWLFPSPQRGDKDIPARTFNETLKLVRAASGCVCAKCAGCTVGKDAARCTYCGSRDVEPRKFLLPTELRKFGFHDLRHHFVSYAVMSGVDYMTIAEWVGHKDGGVLIGRVYGHLADDHRKRQAARLSFGPGVVPEAVAASATE